MLTPAGVGVIARGAGGAQVRSVPRSPLSTVLLSLTLHWSYGAILREKEKQPWGKRDSCQSMERVTS